MEQINILESTLCGQQEIIEIVEKIAELCHVKNIAVLLVDGDHISQPIVRGTDLPVSGETFSLIKKSCKSGVFMSHHQLPKSASSGIQQDLNVVFFRLKSEVLGTIGLLALHDEQKIKLTQLQKNIVRLFAKMICLFVDWEISQKKQAEFANEIESKNNSLREIAMIQSHDIRQPLTTIMGLISLISNDIVIPDKDWIKMMQIATDALDKKIREIIAQTMAEKDLKAIKFNRLVEEIEDYAILLIDIEGNVENWNKGAELIKGYKASEIIGHNFAVFYTRHDVALGLPQKLLAEAAATGKVINEGWRVKKNGEEFWARVLITAIHNEEDKVIGFTKMTHDMTSTITAGELHSKPKQTNQQVTLALNHYAIISLDSKGNIVSWNSGAQRMKGYSAEEVMNKNFSMFYSVNDKQNTLPEKLLGEAVTTGRACSEGWRIKKGGARFLASITITALYDAEGTHIGYTKVTKDLTSSGRQVQC